MHAPVGFVCKDFERSSRCDQSGSRVSIALTEEQLLQWNGKITCILETIAVKWSQLRLCADGGSSSGGARDVIDT